MKPALLSLTLMFVLASAPTGAQEIKTTNTVKETFGVTALAVSPDGKAVAFADNDHELLWRPADGTRRLLLGKHTAPFVSLAFSADGKTIAAFTKDKTVQLFTVGKEEASEKHKVDAAAGLVAFSDGKIVLAHVVTGREGDDKFAEIRLLDVKAGKQRVIARATTPLALPGIGANFQLLALSADGRALAVSSSDPGGTIDRWLVFTATGQKRNLPPGMANNAILALSDGGIVLVTAGKDSLQCWNYAAAQGWSSGKTKARLATISADGRALVAVHAENLVTTYECPGSAAQVQPDRKKANPDRIRGMKAALADIEKGLLKEKMVPPPAPPWWEHYVALLKKECGVELVYVNGEENLTEMIGYNAIMTVEIEYRFGADILAKLAKKAEQDYKAKKAGK